ncbi:hypothetical protein SYK_28070 [Pseudodesulfovibrio nedwellii]|uniref:GspL periplasmic domain-containing protein n=2 Tax=Pseudodesulfovibrio nedwellii TaxID=2973072 RepID=A0ABM8B3P2_9BACT|nr:hypothetical protein SYK_28070 [Pseudodesulfovibrio nedwellii]
MLSSSIESDAKALSMAMSYAMDNNAIFERAVVGIDGRNCILRNFQLPIQNRRQIDQVVAFELDEDLPFERHELVSDYFRGRYSDGTSFLSVASVRKEPVADLIGLFQEQGVEVERIDVDVAAFARACASRFSNYERCVGLEVGKDRMLFCHLVDGQVLSLAVIPWGESFLVNSFATKKGLSVNEVDRIMVFAGENPVEDSGNDIQEAFQKQLEAFVGKQLREIYRLLGDSEWPSRFILSGDVVRIQTFRKAFEEASEGHLDIWDELSLKLGDEVDEGQRGSGLATSFGLTEESDASFNFRKDEFALVGANSVWHQEAWFFAVLFLSIFIAWGAYSYATLIANDRELAYLEEATLQTYKDALPEVSQSLAPMQYQSIISSRVDMLSGRPDDQAGGKSVSVIETLRVVSAVLDKKIDVEFISLNLDSRRIDLQGETRSMNAVDSVRKAIEKTKVFQGAKIKNATANKKSKRIRFEIEVQR